MPQKEKIGLDHIAMATDSRSRAGMFLIGPEEALALANGTIDPERFFLENVLF